MRKPPPPVSVRAPPAMSAPTLSSTTLFGRELLFETADALAEAGRLWPVTAQLAQCIAAECPPPHALRGATVVEVRTVRRAARVGADARHAARRRHGGAVLRSGERV